MLTVPLFYYPTRVLLLDDDPEFLGETAFQLESNTYTVHSLSNPAHALKCLHEERRLPDLLHIIFHNEEEEEYEVHNFHMNLNRLQEIKADPYKHKDVSLLISDYHMPMMTGIDLIKQAPHDSGFKVLLTGEADEQIAVDAFNAGLIHQYIKKHSKTLAQSLRATCDDLTFKFFLQATSACWPNPAVLLGADSPLLSFAFQKWFRSFVKQHNIVEYYLIEVRGTFLMVDHQGNEFIFKLIHADDFDVLLDSAEADAIPEPVLQKLQNQDAYLMHYEAYKVSLPKPQQWADYLCDLQQAQVENTTIQYCLSRLT